MSDVLISVENVSKKFARRLRHAMWYGMCDLGREVAGLTPCGERLRTNEFWALKDVSFELKRGECLGIIGPNGAGKSTLLKLLNGIIHPTQGRIRVRGRLGALIEVGAGFHPMLTGRENIYVNGAILGMGKAEVDRKFDAIVDFADIGDFLDTPVKFYSSGMYVRLGFAVAAHFEPDILLIDEVLAVGDVGFRAKCYRQLYDILPHSAIIFVSHSMAHVSRMCQSVAVLHRGGAELHSNVQEGIQKYLELLTEGMDDLASKYEYPGTTLENLRVTPSVLSADAAVEFSFALRVPDNVRRVSILLVILDCGLTPVMTKKGILALADTQGPHQLRFVSNGLPLSPGSYYLSVAVFNVEPLQQLAWHYAALKFSLAGTSDFLPVPVQLSGEWQVR